MYPSLGISIQSSKHSTFYSEDFAELLMKTETAKIENFTNIEAIKDKLKKEVTSLRDELKNYKANLLEEQERIDEEKMQRLELEEQISEMRKRIKTEATEKAKESGDLIVFIGPSKSRYNYFYLR